MSFICSFLVCASFSQVLIENFIVQRVNFWLVRLTLHLLKLKRSSSLIFLLLSTIKNFNPSSPKVSNNKRFFGGWISIKLHQCVQGLLCLSVLKIGNRYIPFLFLLFHKNLYILLLNPFSILPYNYFYILIFFIFKIFINF